MPPTTTIAVKPPSPLRTVGTTLVTPLESAVEALAIKTDEDYELADELLTRIRQASAKWENRINPIIEPQRTALDAAYALKNEFLHPLQAMEKAVKGEMKGYKERQLQLVKNAEVAQQVEIARLENENRLREAQLKTAKTAPMKAQIQQKQRAVQAEIQRVQQQPTAPTPIKVAGSQVRKKKKPVVTDLEKLLMGILEGRVPMGLVSVNATELRMQFAAQPDVVAKWPGITIEDDIVIAGR